MIFSRAPADQVGLMTSEEMTIVNFLASNPETFFSRKEIARKAVHRKIYEENQHWADVALASLIARGEVEQNSGGFYRFKRLDA